MNFIQSSVGFNVMVMQRRSIVVILILVLTFSCKPSPKNYYEVAGGEVIFHYFEKYGGWGGSYHESQRKVEGADPSSFQELRYDYAKDENSVFYKGRFVRRDVTTFKILDNIYTLDKSHVYIQNKQMPQSYPESFTILNQGYSKDKKQVYHEDGYVLEDVDTKSFEVLQHRYARDAINVYKDGKILKGVSAKDLIILSRDYIRDNQAVYYRGSKLKSANAKSFKKLSHFYYTDSHFVWYDNELLNADIETFKVFEERVMIDSMYYTAEDRNFYYQGAKATRR